MLTEANLAIGFCVTFLAILSVLHVLEPEFNPSHLISEYQLGRVGWLMVRPPARRRERRLPVHRIALRVLLQGLPGFRALPRTVGHSRSGRRNGHLPDAAWARDAYRRHGRHAVPAPLRQGLALVHQLLPDPD